MSVLACLLLACGAVACSSDTQAGDPTSAPGTSGSQTAESGEPAAIEVSLQRTGGLKGQKLSLDFSAHHAPPAGFTRQDVQDVLELASDPALRELPAKPLPANTCCDRYTYVVKITWDDGNARTFTAIDGGTAPQVIERLIDAMA